MVNLAFVAYNALSSVSGFAVDALTPRPAAIVGTVMWTVLVGIIGVSPNNGVAFSIGFVGLNIASVMLFFSIFIVKDGLLPASWPQALPGALVTGFWDAGAFTFIILSHISSSLPTTPSLASLFGYFALITGALTVLFFAVFFPPQTLHCKNFLGEMKSKIVSMHRYVRVRFYWALVANIFAVVSYGYFWLPLIVNHMQWKGASSAEAADYNTAFAWMLPSLGAPASLVAAFIIKFDNPRTLAAAFVVQALLSALIALFACIPGPLPLQYVTFLLFILWRMSGFCIINACFSSVFPDFAVIGTAHATIYTFSGLLSIAVDQGFAVDLVISNPNNFLPIHLSFCAFGVLAAATAAVWVHSDLESNSKARSFHIPSKELEAPAVAVTPSTQPLSSPPIASSPVNFHYTSADELALFADL